MNPRDKDKAETQVEISQLTAEQMKQVAEEFLRKKRESLSTCGQGKAQQDDTDEVYARGTA